MKHVTIGEHEFEFDHLETYTDTYRKSARNVLKVFCPNTVLPEDIGGYLNDSDLSSITFVDERTDYSNNTYIENTIYRGYELILGYGLEMALISNGDPQSIGGEEYIEYTVFTLAQLTKQEKKLIDLGIDPWNDLEDLDPVTEVVEPEEE